MVEKLDEWRDLVTVAEAKVELKIKSSTTIWNWVARGWLPKPAHLGQRAVWNRRDFNMAKAKLLTPPEAP